MKNTLTLQQAELLSFLEGCHGLDGSTINPVELFSGKEERLRYKSTFTAMTRKGYFSVSKKFKGFGKKGEMIDIFEPNLSMIRAACQNWLLNHDSLPGWS